MKVKDINYIPCPYCGYNNKDYNIHKHPKCLRCSKPMSLRELDPLAHFRISYHEARILERKKK